jgi:putative membrane protein
MSRKKKIGKDTKLVDNLEKISEDITDHEKILVICVDRDNDIGEKINVSGPIIGLKNNLKVATNFAIADPEDSDANSIFGGIKIYKKLEKETQVEIVTLTGHSKSNLLFADKNIALQLKQVLDVFPATGAVFVSDGAEDDQVIPLIQNFVPIISKETIIVRQSKGLESTFYTIKRSLQDPFFARIVMGVPAIVLLLYVFFRQYSLQIIAFLLGMYLLIKGFNLDKRFARFGKGFKNKFSIFRISLPFYLGFLFFLIFSIVKGLNLFFQNQYFDLLFVIVSSIRAVILQLVIAFILFVIGNIIDLFYFKKMYHLGKNIFALFFILIFAIIVDFALQFIIQEINVTYFLMVLMFGSILLVLISRFTVLFDVHLKITPLIIGLPVYSRYGLFLGEVLSIDDKRNILKYKEKNTEKIKTISAKNFILEDGKILI